MNNMYTFTRIFITSAIILTLSGCVDPDAQATDGYSWQTAQQVKSGCDFCDIVTGKGPATVIMRDNEKRVMAIEKTPGARKYKTSILIIPTTHIENLKEIDPQNPDHVKIMANMIETANKLSKLLTGNGDYQTEFHTGRGAGQSVMHLHMHFQSNESWKNPSWRK